MQKPDKAKKVKAVAPVQKPGKAVSSAKKADKTVKAEAVVPAKKLDKPVLKKTKAGGSADSPMKAKTQ